MIPLPLTLEILTLLAVLFGIPILTLLRRPTTRDFDLPQRSQVCIGIVWLGIVLHRFLIGLPSAKQRAQLNGNVDYDGSAGNNFVIWAGWFPALVSTAIVYIAYVGFRTLMRRRRASRGSA